jgi:hypothetical protein
VAFALSSLNYIVYVLGERQQFVSNDVVTLFRVTGKQIAIEYFYICVAKSSNLH